MRTEIYILDIDISQAARQHSDIERNKIIASILYIHCPRCLQARATNSWMQLRLQIMDMRAIWSLTECWICRLVEIYLFQCF